MDHYVVLVSRRMLTTKRSPALSARWHGGTHPDVGAGYSPVEFQRAREAQEALVDPERRRRYDLQLRRARAALVVVRHVVISRPFAEPLLGSHHTSLGVPTAWVAATRPSFFDELVEEIFASFDDPWSAAAGNECPQPLKT